MPVTRWYAGVGSRETPPDVLDTMSEIAVILVEHAVCRTGGAEGADRAFYTAAFVRGGPDAVELYLPWDGFGGFTATHPAVRLAAPAEWAYRVAAEHHPGWRHLSQGARKLHARNVHQVLGPNNDPAEYAAGVICWTPGGKGLGGTGQAIRVARAHDIPVADLATPADMDVVRAFF